MQPVTESQIFVLAQQRFMLNPPLGETFVVNSEPHTGARPSVRLCAGLIKEGSSLISKAVRSRQTQSPQSSCAQVG
jgi:hypothetical protein